MNIDKFIKQRFNLTESTNDWWRMDDGKTAINFSIGVVKNFSTNTSTNLKYWCFKKVENFKEYLPELTFNYVQFPLKSQLTKFDGIELPEHFILLDDNHPDAKFGRDFLEKRNFNLQTAFDNNFGVCTSGKFIKRLIIPIHCDYVLRYCTMRSLLNQKPKYLNTENSNKSKYVVGLDKAQFYKKIYVFEGVLDKLQWGDDAIALGGSDISPYQISQLVNKCHPDTEFVLIHDRGFYRQFVSIGFILSKCFKIKVPDIPYLIAFKKYIKDFCDLDQSGRGKEIIKTYERNTEYLFYRNISLLFK